MNDDFELPLQPCANACGTEMDMTRAVWWCVGGACCSEGCAREFSALGAQKPAASFCGLCSSCRAVMTLDPDLICASCRKVPA